MKQRIFETLVGFLVVSLAIYASVYAYNISRMSSSSKDMYILEAKFQNIDGLSVGSDVKISGIKIGTVDKINLDTDSYSAIVNILISNDVQIPLDSRAAISTSGLIGGKYLSITPGASEENLKHNEKIKFTQSALNIEDLIGKLMYSVTSK